MKIGLTRRQALGLAGAAGAAYVAGPLGPLTAPGEPGTEVAEGATTCVLAPEVTEGPYWVDVGLNRSDVTEGQAGVPLALDVYVYRSDDSCEPEQGAVVDIWHCNAEGLYSDEAVERTSGQTWLRGYQETDASGLASFRTVFPGWYSGRTVHIHVRVRTFSGSTTTYNFTTQIFFTEADTATAYATGPYSSRPGPDTSHAADSIYQQEARAGNVLEPALSGNAGSGFSGSVGIGLSGLPATSTGRSGGESSADGKVEAKLLSQRFRRSGGRRELALRLRAEERVAANARLLRGGKAIAHKRIAALKGNAALAVPIGGHVAAGPARLELTLTDRDGNSKVIRHRVHLPAA